MTTLAYIALGSNLNNPRKQLQNAIKYIRAIPACTILKESSVYKTTPLGPQNQPDFINQVIAVETDLSAHELLRALQKIETHMGRVRTVHWGPRVIDCDIILFGEEAIHTAELVVPHPEYKKRDFVLRPLYEIAPHLEKL